MNHHNFPLTPPERKQEPTGNFNEYGKPMYSSREWHKDEKAAYVNEVLMPMMRSRNYF